MMNTDITDQLVQNAVQQIQDEEDKVIWATVLERVNASRLIRHAAHNIVHVIEGKKKNLAPGDPVQHQHDGDSYGVIISIEHTGDPRDPHGRDDRAITVLWSRVPLGYDT